MPQPGWVINNRHFSLTLLGAGSSRWRCGRFAVLQRPFLVHTRCLLTGSSHGRRGEGALWASFMGARFPFMRLHPHDLVTFQGLASSSHHLEGWEDTNTGFFPPCDPAIPLLGIYQREVKIHVHTETYIACSQQHYS